MKYWQMDIWKVNEFKFLNKEGDKIYKQVESKLV